MASDTEALFEAEEKQPEAMPASEQTPSEAPEKEEVAPQEVPEPSTTEETLPDDVKKRTAEQFEKLKERGAQDRVQIEELENYIGQLQKQAPQQPADLPPLYDAATGGIYVNELENLRKGSTDAQGRAEKAEKKLEQYIADQQEREAIAEFPQLDRKSKEFDSDLNRATRATLTDSIINPRDYGGKELTMLEAAKMASGVKEKKLEEVKETAKQETLEELTPKEQASLEASGRSDRRTETLDTDDLAQRTREGDIDAIMERLKGIPSV